MSAPRRETVSNDADLLILVDEHDQEIGQLDKQACHDGAGTLHRAFSVFIFNTDGDLLLQQRASDKRLWPEYWSNTCCSHPRIGEAMDDAVQRRCQEELGFQTPLTFVYKFQYQAQYGDAGAEHELCSVYVGHYSGNLDVNHSEVAATRWISQAALANEMSSNPDRFTPWFQMEWQTLNDAHGQHLP